MSLRNAENRYLNRAPFDLLNPRYRFEGNDLMTRVFWSPGHRDQNTRSPGRSLTFWFCFLSCVGQWRGSHRPPFKAHITCVTERRALAARYPPGWIYGVVAPFASSQQSLAAAEAATVVLKSSTWIEEGGTLNLIWMPLHAVCWFLCCRQGFSLLGRDYGEKEEEESFELRNKEDLTPSGRVTIHLHYAPYLIHTRCPLLYVNDVTLQKPRLLWTAKVFQKIIDHRRY